MSGISTTDLNTNLTLKTAVISGIAQSVGVPSSYVTISVSRRLSPQRQLAGSAKVSYTITIPFASAVTASTVATLLGGATIGNTLKTKIQSSLAATGDVVTLSVANVTLVTTTTTTTTAAPAASGAVVKFGLPLVFAAMSLL